VDLAGEPELKAERQEELREEMDLRRIDAQERKS
jgi:hypothetical protein